MPAIRAAWLTVGGGGLDAVSLGLELLLPTAGATGGTYPRGIPGA